MWLGPEKRARRGRPGGCTASHPGSPGLSRGGTAAPAPEAEKQNSAFIHSAKSSVPLSAVRREWYSKYTPYVNSHSPRDRAKYALPAVQRANTLPSSVLTATGAGWGGTARFPAAGLIPDLEHSNTEGLFVNL